MNDEYATKEDVQDAKEEVALRIHVYTGILFGILMFCITGVFMVNGEKGWWMFYVIGWFLLFYVGSYTSASVSVCWNATFGRVDALHASETLEDYNDE